MLYEEATLDWDKNKRKSKVFMVSTDGGDRWQYLSEEGGSAFQFSPDGKYLTFLRKTKSKDGAKGDGGGGKAGNEKATQIFWMRTAGGEAVALTEHNTSVRAYKWSADAKTILFSALDERPEDEDKRLKAGADVVFVNEGANGQKSTHWSNLWAFDVESKEVTQLTEAKFILADFDPSPDGKRVALTARYRNRRNDADRTEIFVLDRETKKKQRLTENAAPERRVLWAPDSRHFAFLAADAERWLNRNEKIWIMDADSGVARQLSSQFEGAISNPVWTSDGRSLLFTGQEGTRSNLFSMEIASGTLESLTDVQGWLRVSSFSRDRTRFAYAYSDPRKPEDLYAGHLEGMPGRHTANGGDRQDASAHRHGSRVATAPLASSPTVGARITMSTRVSAMYHFHPMCVVAADIPTTFARATPWRVATVSASATSTT